MQTSVLSVRLPVAQLEWLDTIARRKAAGKEPKATRSDVVKELVGWAMGEGFFGREGKAKKRGGKK